MDLMAVALEMAQRIGEGRAVVGLQMARRIRVSLVGMVVVEGMLGQGLGWR